jgi:hypothetical protein
MARMTRHCIIALGGLASVTFASIAAAAGTAREGAVVVPLDAERVVNGVAAACTGIGQTKSDPRWLAYSTRIEFSNPAREYLANEGVAVFNAAGERLASVTCEGPWVLLKLAPGAYRAEAWLRDQPAASSSAKFRAPAKGQLRVVMQFP